MGFILKNDEVIEVKNICHDPENGFEISGEDLVKYMDEAVATWHTHPGDTFTSNLSVADYHGFLNYPSLTHYIVAKDGVTGYIIKDRRVLVAD